MILYLTNAFGNSLGWPRVADPVIEAPMSRGETAICPYAAINFEDSICRANGSASPPFTTFSSPGLTGRQQQNGSSVRSRARCSQPFWNRWSWRLRLYVHLENRKVADPMIETRCANGYWIRSHGVASVLGFTQRDVCPALYP